MAAFSLTRSLSSSLGAKVLVLITVVSVAAFGALFLANASWQRAHALHEIERAADNFADIVQQAVETPMAKGDNASTIEQFVQIAKNHKDIAVLMTDFKGNVTYATDQTAVRKDFQAVYAEPAVNEAVKGILKGGPDAHLNLTVKGVESFVQVTGIKNAPECHHCHGRSKPVLGASVMVQDISQSMAGLTTLQVRGAAVSLGGLGALLVSLLFFMRRVVVGPVKRIAGYVADVEKGVETAGPQVAGHDELAGLSGHLTKMVSEMRDQLEYNRSVLAGIVVPLFVTDQDGYVEYVNQALTDLYRVKAENLSARHAAEGVMTGEAVRELDGVLSGGKPASGRMILTLPGGAAAPCTYELSPLRNAAGEVVGVIGAVIDLTEEEAARERVEAQRKNLLLVAEQVSATASQLDSAAQTLTDRMSGLTRAVDQSASQTAQVATAMEEMNATVLEVARTAGQGADAADKARGEAQSGDAEAKSAAQATGEVAQTAERLSKTLGALATRAENIGQVMGVINDIADQTNLLALNAAIEAARAGDAGRGFAVVADEVRKLAEKTMHATKDVGQALESIRQGADEAVREMGESRERVTAAASQANRAGEAFGRIVSSSEAIADLVRNIAAAAEQQSATSEEINLNVGQIDELSRALLSGIQEAESSIRDVSGQVRELNLLAAKFKS